MAAKFCFAAVAAILPANEAFSLHRSINIVGAVDSGHSNDVKHLFSEKDKTMKEMMASMSMENAYDIFMRMNHSQIDKKLMALIEGKIGKQHVNGEDGSAPTGYAAVDTARDMLNSMIDEATMKKELEGVDCREADISQFAMIQEVEHQISYDNSEAAAAKAETLRASGVIQIIKDDKLPQNRQELTEHNSRCAMEIATLKSQLAIVAADIEVMKKILSMVCADDVRTTTSPFFLQYDQDDDSGDMSMSLVKCVSCLTGRQAAWVKHNRLQTLLSGVKSEVAKEYIQQHLLAEFAEGQRRMPTATRTVLLQREEINREMSLIAGIDLGGATTSPRPSGGKCNELASGANGTTYRGCQDQTLTGRSCQRWSLQTPHGHDFTPALYNLSGIGDHNYCRNPDNKKTIWCYTTDTQKTWEYCQPKLVLDAPTGMTKSTCVEADMCKLNKADCNNLKDRFLRIMAGIVDTHSSLSDEVADKEKECKETREDYERTISSLENQLAEEQKNLAAATKTMIENMQSSADGNAKHAILSGAYHKKMKDCCDQRNSYNSEICALAKIRGELYKLEGKNVIIIDCEVGDWVDEECTVSCGGGTQKRVRSIIMHPNNGAQCPPLKMERTCNAQGCPVDCKVDDWAGWSDCTAECGGGVQNRARTKTRDPEHGGDVCPDLTETRECHGQACSADCVLGDWGGWGLCSKACGKGSSERMKKITEPARGQGTCPSAAGPQRLHYQDCNDFPCEQMLHPNQTLLECSAMMDVIIVFDGSGSLGKYGWTESKDMLMSLTKAMKTGPHNVNLGVLLFSGPLTWEDLMDCTGDDPSAKPTDEQCGMRWISELTDGTPDLLSKERAMEWPRGTTLTAMALAKADAELINGRQDAHSVVIVITDGKPMSPIKTGKAAANIKKKARLMWVPVGKGAIDGVDNMKKWASQPWEDNVLEVDTFAVLNTPSTINNLVAGYCDTLE